MGKENAKKMNPGEEEKDENSVGEKTATLILSMIFMSLIVASADILPLSLVSEIMTLLAQVNTIMLTAGIAIYAIRFPILREGTKAGFTKLTANQLERLERKETSLFGFTSFSFIYLISSKILIYQPKLSGYGNLFLLGALILFAMIFSLFYSLLAEVWKIR